MKNYQFTTLSETKRNVHHENVDKRTIEWANGFNLLKISDNQLKNKIVTLDLSLFMSLTFPHVNAEQLQLINDFTFFVFILDDIMEASEPETVEYLRNQLTNILKDKEWELRSDLLFNVEDFFIAWKNQIVRF